MLFGAMRDKAIGAMRIELNKSFDEIHLTEIEYERSASIKDLKKICSDSGIIASEENNALHYINKFIKGNKENCLVVQIWHIVHCVLCQCIDHGNNLQSIDQQSMSTSTRM